MNCFETKKRANYELKAEQLNKKMTAKAKQINKIKLIQQNKVYKYL